MGRGGAKQRVRIQQRKRFEPIMCKYYPKKSRFLYQDLDYQASDANKYDSSNSRVLQRYKRTFFRSFSAGSKPWTCEPSKIPNNLQSLVIFSGSAIFLKKIIKQNKRLRHIVIQSGDDELDGGVVRYLKYSKSVRSIKFSSTLPYFSEKQCEKMLKTWGRTVEIFKSLLVQSQYERDGESFKRVMETVLKFPKLKRFVVKYSVENAGRYFPFDKLQERNIPYKVGFGVNGDNLKSLKKNYPQFKPMGLVVIDVCSSTSYGKLGYDKFKEYTKQTLVLQHEIYKNEEVFLAPVFQNILALELTIIGTRWSLSGMGQLNSLKHLAISFVDDEDADIFGDLFKYLNKNVACHKKLETFMLRLHPTNTNIRKKSKKEPADEAILKFFEACSESLKTVHLDLPYPSLNKELLYPEYFYEGLSKLKNMQSLRLTLDFGTLSSKQKIEKLCEIISEIKSLEELDFRIRKYQYKEKRLT